MKLDLYFPNVTGIYLEPLALKLTPRPGVGEDFVFVITVWQYDALRTVLREGDQTKAYEKIEALILASGLDVPMWLLAEPGTGI